MANEMATNGINFDPVVSYARLSERVEGQGRDIVDLRSNMNTGFSNIQGSLKALSDQFSGSTRTQWPVIWSAIGVCFTVLAGIGAALYVPVLGNQARLENAMVKLVEVSVTQKEMEWRTARGMEDRQRTEKAVYDLRDAQVPRQELDRVFEGLDRRLADHQRQIDEIKQAQAGQYNQKDLNRDILERMDRIERSRGGGAIP